MITELRQALEEVARRFRRVRLWSGLAACWLAWALLGVGLSYLWPSLGRAGIPGEWLLAAYAAMAAATGLACVVLARRSVQDGFWVARRIEAKHPELGTGLLAAVEQVASLNDQRLGFLQTAVIRQALDHRQTHAWHDTVSNRTIRGMQAAHVVALGTLLVVFFTLIGQVRSQAHEQRGILAGLLGGSDVQVDPGSTELERGTALLVIARFPGAVPGEASLVVENGPEGTSQLAMTRSLDDPTFASRVESVTQDLDYHVAYEGRQTSTYHVHVFEYPELERTDAQLVFPKYTALESKTVEDIRHVTAVEGTALTLLCRLNKEVASAALIDEKEQSIPLKLKESGSTVYTTSFPLTESRRYRVQLVDREGRRNKNKTEIAVNVTRNRPPVVTLTQPSHDVRVSPVEELSLAANISDDFGLIRQGVSYTLAGKEPRDIVLGEAKPGPKQVKAEHLLDFESLRVKPDELVTYYFWAEDYGPDGEPRRTAGDMFFAEVRHFEEIFRQGEQPPGGSSENEGEQNDNARAAEQLAELQKQIVNGTWKLIRRELGAKPTAKLPEDARTLQESQQAAIEQAAQVAQRLRDPGSKASLELAVDSMREAAAKLAEASKPAIAPLNPALVAEQAAYQALLKLRAREFQVSRSNRQRNQRGGASAGGPSDRQLQQLELSNDENRYEEQRSARAQQEQLSQREQAQRETRQVLNRLRELAQRQTDLNDRLKELQSALEAAKTQAAREEIERQLKRLREQEQQILRDTDELRERMENEENRERMAEARQQVEQSRENVRRASEALERGRLSQALTEGSRAGRQLNDLREQVRKEASNRFSEDMTEMRNQARQLDQDQKKLTEQLEKVDKQPQQSLRDTGERKEVKNALEQQSKGLDNLLDKMRQTVQEAEESEPLLAKSLFDTVRKANDPSLPDALKGIDQLVDAGVPQEATNLSRRVGQGIEQMRQGVEKAAESVLGDETAALKRAQGELDDLANQLQREIAQSTGQPNPDDRRPSGASSQRRANRLRNNNDPNQPATKGQTATQEGEQNGERPDPQQGENPQQPGEGQRPRDNGQGQPTDRQQRQGNGRRQPGEGQQREQQKGQQRPGQGGEQAGGQQAGEAQPKREPDPFDATEMQTPGDQQAGEAQSKGQGQRRGQRGQGGLRGANAPQEGERQEPGQDQPANAEEERQGGAQGGGGRPGGARRGGVEQLLNGMNNQGPGGPITGEGFRQWSDRLRDVEELLDDPELRSEAARIRDRVRGAREEFKRHAKLPDWTQLQQLVADPIKELRNRVAEEVKRRESPDSLVPIDRDPVPPQYAEAVRRYYERLGSGR